MIQRVQSIYLLISIVLLGLCCVLPLGTLELNGITFSVYNWSIVSGDAFTVSGIMLICTLLACVVFSFICLFAFSDRNKQLQHIRIITVLHVVYYVLYAITAWTLSRKGHFMIGLSVVLPVFSLIFIFLAKHGIKKDEALVRDAERIR